MTRVDAAAPQHDSPALTEAAAATLEMLRAGASHPLVQSFPAGAMLIFDRDLRYLCAGGLALADVGLSTALMENKTIFEVFEPDFVAVIEPQYRLALSGVESVIDLHYGGNIYSQRLAPVRDEDGEIVAGMGYTQDVTHARRAEQALLESEAHTRLAFDNAPIGNALMTPDGRYDRVNQAMCDLTGYTAEQLAELTAIGVTHPDDRAADTIALAQLLSGELTTSTLDKRFLTASGATVWATQSASLVRAEDGTPLHFILQIQDITERKDQEQLLADERRRLHDAEAMGRLGSWELDLETRVVVWSDGLFRLHGIDPEEFVGDVEGGLRFIHPEDRDGFLSEVTEAAREGKAFNIRYRVLRPDDGSLRWFDARGDLQYEDGRARRLSGTASDVTESVLAEAEAAAAHAMQRAIITTSPDILFVYDFARRSIVWSNRSMRRTLGYDQPEAGDVGVDSLSLMLAESDRGAFDQTLAEAAAADDGDIISLDYRMRHADGSLRWFANRITVLDRDEAGAVTQLVGVARDITDAVAAEERLQHSALHDDLTGLPNRAQLTERLSTAIAGCQDNGGALAVLFCDLDGFKRVNDIAGHAAGDFVLVETARRLVGAVRDTDVVARVGGDEFVVVIDPVNHGRSGPKRSGTVPGYDLDLAARICGRIVDAVREPITYNGVEHVVTASIGLSYGAPGGDARTLSTPEQVLQDADAAMYKAKSHGKDRFELFEQGMRADVVERGRVEQVLRRALRRALVTAELTAADSEVQPAPNPDAPTFAAAYQPIFDSRTHALVGFEALARLMDAGGVAIPPDIFIAIAEDTGLIRPLGRLMLTLACQQLAEWRATYPGLEQVTVAVNVSGIQAQEGSLGDDVCLVLDETGLSPQDLVLEVTETALLQATPATITGLQVLRDKGVGIAIDDFGTGYASLRYLATLPVSILKIDKSFTAGLPDDGTKTKIVFAVAGLAADLDLGCVVEGVETEAQRDALPGGVHLQGWLTGRPQLADAVDVATLVGRAGT